MGVVTAWTMSLPNPIVVNCALRGEDDCDGCVASDAMVSDWW